MNLKVIGQNPYQLYGAGGIGTLRGSSLGIGQRRPFRPRAQPAQQQHFSGRTLGQAKTFDDIVADSRHLVSNIRDAQIRSEFQSGINACLVGSESSAGRSNSMSCLNSLNAAMTAVILEQPGAPVASKFPGGIVAIGVLGVVAAWALFG